jgi:hypothetical protein
MKTLLAILLSFVISEAPVLAIHGGYELGGQAGTVGTYAGVMIPTAIQYLNGTTEESGTLETPVSGFGINSIGIFTMSVPNIGVGAGTLYLFSTTQSMSGSITDIPDPRNNGGIYGTIVVTGSIAEGFVVDLLDLATTTLEAADGQGVGTLYVTTANSTNSVSPNGINLTGSSDVTFSSENFDTGVFTPYEEIKYDVDGFQQSSAATETSGS